MRTTDLIEILDTLKKAFPSLSQISSYGRAQTLVKKSPRAIKEICGAGMHTTQFIILGPGGAPNCPTPTPWRRPGCSMRSTRIISGC